MKARRNRRQIMFLKKKKDRKIPAHLNANPRKTLGSTAPVSYYRPINAQQRWEIISSYGRVLERCSSPVELESSLPFPKGLIRQAIYEELVENPESDLRGHLEVAFVQLESFLPPDEFKVIQDFKMAGALAEEIARSGDPHDIVESARILKRVRGDTAVKIQENISEKMARRMEQIRAIGMPMFPAPPCSCAY